MVEDEAKEGQEEVKRYNNTEGNIMSKTASVDEWIEILTHLVENGDVPETSEPAIRRIAWKLAQNEDELVRLRTLAGRQRQR